MNTFTLVSRKPDPIHVPPGTSPKPRVKIVIPLLYTQKSAGLFSAVDRIALLIFRLLPKPRNPR